MDIRQQITDDIIEAMEKEGGIPPWRAGWTSHTAAINASSERPYKGINQLILGMQPYSDPRWMTYLQTKKMGTGVIVRHGEKGTRIVKMVEVDSKQRDNSESEQSEVLVVENGKKLVMKQFFVFNAEQVDGLVPLPERIANIQPADAVQAVVFGLQDTGMKLNFGGNQPAYYPRTDEIRIPVASDFHSLDDFHATLLHEAAHASGHPKRLARLHMDARFGSAEYSREELRAEIASAMMVGIMGLPLSETMIDSHAAYLSSWLNALRQDKNEIFKAAADAQKICDYLSEHALSTDLAFSENTQQATATTPKPKTTATPTPTPTPTRRMRM